MRARTPGCAALLTDGDIRRAILRKVPLDAPIETIATMSPGRGRRPRVRGRKPFGLMIEHDINQLPVVDDDGSLRDFLLRKDLVADAQPDLSAVIMAGGYGKRLLPLTEHVPKPMLPVGDRPLLERTIEQLRRSGIHEVHLTTHYLPESIVQHFGDGEAFGVSINYSNEDEPLGTAGGLEAHREGERAVPGHQWRHPHRGVLPADAPATTRSMAPC